MDPVSSLLLERERKQLKRWIYVTVSLLLHGALVVAVFLAGRISMARPAQLPSVSVRLVRPEPQPPKRNRGAQRNRQAPRPTAPPKPQPTQVPLPTAAPVVATAVPDPVTHSPDAMAAPEVTPQPTQPTQPEGEPGGPAGPGLSLGEGSSGSSAPGIPSDFQFTYYVNRMLALIESRWYKPPVPTGTKARVRFTILKTGRVQAIELEESSQVPSFDRAALRALYAANPLPPLPPGYSKTSLTIHLTFSE